MSRSRTKITLPTYITITRMVFSILFFVFMLSPGVWAKIVALVLFALGALSDKIDGALARKQNTVTDLGVFLDPLADKMLVNLALLALVVQGVVPAWVFAVILVRDFAVDGMRMAMARNGATIAASFYGKLKTTVQMISLIILIANLVICADFLAVIGDIALYTALILTVFSGIDYLAKGYKNIK